MLDGATSAATAGGGAGEGRGCALSVRGLVYEVGGQRLLDVPSLELVGCETVVIMGPNGAGKSLFLRLLHGLIVPDRGEIRYRGFRGGGDRPRQAMVFQKPVLLRRSVAANVDYALKVQGVGRIARRRRVQELLQMGGLLAQARQPARTLSGGEAQRLALVRALAGEPEILFLDEPTASLDPSAAVALEALIAEAASAGTRVMLVTHDLGLAHRLGGEVVFLHQGRVAEQASVERFFAGPRTEAARSFLARNLVL